MPSAKLELWTHLILGNGTFFQFLRLSLSLSLSILEAINHVFLSGEDFHLKDVQRDTKNLRAHLRARF